MMLFHQFRGAVFFVARRYCNHQGAKRVLGSQGRVSDMRVAPVLLVTNIWIETQEIQQVTGNLCVV
jgi:hypothetical protein